MEWRGNAQPNREVVCGVKCTQRRVLTASTEYIRRFLGGFMAKYCEFLDGVRSEAFGLERHLQTPKASYWKSGPKGPTALTPRKVVGVMHGVGTKKKPPKKNRYDGHKSQAWEYSKRCNGYRSRAWSVKNHTIVTDMLV